MTNDAGFAQHDKGVGTAACLRSSFVMRRQALVIRHSP